MRYPSLLFVITLIFTMVSFTGCSSKVPGQSAVDVAVRTLMAKQVKNGTFEIINVKKTNGHPVDENTYIVETEVNLKFKKNFSDIKREVMKKAGFWDLGDQAGKLEVIENKLGNFKVGEDKIVKLKCALIKTEKGWLVSDQQGWLGI